MAIPEIGGGRCNRVLRNISAPAMTVLATLAEFPSFAQAVAAHDGPAYQQALQALGDGAVRDVRIIDAAE